SLTSHRLPLARAGKVHCGLHREANAERMFFQLAWIEHDAHREALHDLDPVACGILGRYQCEGRAGAAAEADHLAVEDDIASVQVGGESDRLADAYLSQLAFLEVGVDIHFVDRDND